VIGCPLPSDQLRCSRLDQAVSTLNLIVAVDYRLTQRHNAKVERVQAEFE
jgi:hypothetical protein